MMRTRFCLIAVCIAASLTAGSAAQTRTWPPGLQTVPAESPALSPDAEMKTFVLPPGYRVELVASEPMVENPILDRLGSVGTAVGHRDDRLHAGSAGHQRARADRPRSACSKTRTATARWTRRPSSPTGLVLPRALKVLDNGVLVAEPPHLWFMPRHRTGDPQAGQKELVCDCYGTALANVEHNANSLMWALDNWMHTSEGDTYLRLKDGKFETRKTLSRGQWGASQDDFGRIYRNSNSSALARRPRADAVLRPQSQPARARAAATSSWGIRTS